MNLLSDSKLFSKYGKPIIGTALALVIFTLFFYLPMINASRIFTFDELPTWEVQNPVSNIFVMDQIPPTTGSLAAGDSTVPDDYLVDPAIDTLMLLMETQGTYLHRTALHPQGIVNSNDIVIIKGNFIFESRNTTSTDRIKGLIWQILQHPDGFTGEILVGDNTQISGSAIDHNDNNSEDLNQSVIDVINTFSSKGYPVYLFEWKDIMHTVVAEYSEGDYEDGYLYEPESKISYPKFLSPSGNYYISLHFGIWDSTYQTYDQDRLCIVDFPVLKAHSMAGATIAIKNWIGVLTTTRREERYGGSDSMHYKYLFGQYALVAKVMGKTYPKITILDAAWTNTSGNSGGDTLQTNMLFGSTDPCALSWYAAKFALTPIASSPGNTDPDLPGSKYKMNLGAWTECLVDSGFDCTKDSSKISVYNREALFVTSSDNRVDLVTPQNFQLYQNYSNPFNPKTKIKYEIPERSFVTIKVYDVLGNKIATLVNEEKLAGIYEIEFSAEDGSASGGDAYELSSGIYFYSMQALPDGRQTGGFFQSKKMILLR